MKAKRSTKRGVKPSTLRRSRLDPKEDGLQPTPPTVDDLPLYCDFNCPKADFPPADAVGACRREQAVWCSVLREFNAKNSRCKVK
jgi:hypothetical protein